MALPSGLRVLLDEDPARDGGGGGERRGGRFDRRPAGRGGARASGRASRLPRRRFHTARSGGRGRRQAQSEPAGCAHPSRGRGDERAHDAGLSVLLRVRAAVRASKTCSGSAIARLADPLVGVSEEAFALERRIVGNESRFRDGHAPDGVGGERAAIPILFPLAPPLRAPDGRDRGEPPKLTLDQARSYAAKNFRPERMTLLVSTPPGAISLAAITAEAAARAAWGREASRGASGAGEAGRRTPANARASRGARWNAGCLRCRCRSCGSPGRCRAATATIGLAEEVLSRWAQEDVASEQVLAGGAEHPARRGDGAARA